MNFIKLVLDRFKKYAYSEASNIEMNILGHFLSSDVGCYNPTFKEWALSDKSNPKTGFTWGIGGNTTFMEEEEDGLIYLESSIPLEEGEERVYFKSTPEQFAKILDNWEQKVCKLKPNEVTIRHIGDEFIFETKD